LLFFLRNPNRTPPPGDFILSPADGIIVNIQNEEGWAKISIFMKFTNVHVQWVPYPGKITSIKKIAGPAYPAYLPQADHNKQMVTTIQTKIGQIILKQMVGILVRRIETFVKVDKQIKIGQRFGRITFGSRVELWLPSDKVDILAQKKQKVLAGLTVVAKPKI
jgi:phosphatidylserine decarboxylase